jgi:hypothetical protein
MKKLNKTGLFPMTLMAVAIVLAVALVACNKENDEMDDNPSEFLDCDSEFNAFAKDIPTNGKRITNAEYEAIVAPLRKTMPLKYEQKYFYANYKKNSGKWRILTDGRVSENWWSIEGEYQRDRFKRYEERYEISCKNDPVINCELTFANGYSGDVYSWIKGDNKGKHSDYYTGGGGNGDYQNYYLYADQSVNGEACKLFGYSYGSDEPTSFFWFSINRGRSIMFVSYHESKEGSRNFDNQYLSYYYPHKALTDESKFNLPAGVVFTKN